jgi:hypothetical protein
MSIKFTNKFIEFVKMYIPVTLALMKNCSLAYFIILLTLFRWVLYLRRRKGELFCFTCLWSRSLILDSGEYVINNEDKANILNNFFCSITEIENSNVLTPDFHDRTGNTIDTLHITVD